MARSFLLLSVSTSLSITAGAQIQMNYAITPAYSTRALRPVDLGGGNTMYACERAFGWDSSYVEMLWTAPDHSITNSISYRLQTPLTFLNHAAALDDGFALCGITYGDWPFVLKTDFGGSVQWYSWLDNLGNFHDQVMRIIPRGTDFSVYTGRGGMYSPVTYRLEVNSAGSAWSGNMISAPVGVQLRVYEALAMPDPIQHMVGGTAYSNTDPQNMLAMLMWTDATGATWMKSYDMQPSTTSQSEEVYSLAPTSDGNFLCAGYVTTGATTFEGFIMKINASGGVIWCQRYEDTSGGLILTAVTEMLGGYLMAAGEDANYQCMVLNLTSTGDVMQARRYQPAGGGIELTDDFFANTMGELKLMTRDKVINFSSGGASCDFVDVSSVSGSLYSPTVAVHTMTNSPFTPTTQPMNTFVRTPVLGWTPTCVISAIHEPPPSEILLAHPVPSSDIVQLGRTGQIAANERVIMRDIAGTVRYEGAYGTGIDVRALSSGMYICEVAGTLQRARIIRQ